MSEKRIQVKLYDYLYERRHHHIVPNIYIYSWESDLVAMTKDNFLFEFEIKISRSDYKADFKKEKHKLMLKGKGANKFYFVTDFPLQIREIPKYAGWILVQDKVKIMKKAPFMHKKRVKKDVFSHMGASIYARFWQLFKFRYGE